MYEKIRTNAKLISKYAVAAFFEKMFASIVSSLMSVITPAIITAKTNPKLAPNKYISPANKEKPSPIISISVAKGKAKRIE